MVIINAIAKQHHAYAIINNGKESALIAIKTFWPSFTVLRNNTVHRAIGFNKVIGV